MILQPWQHICSKIEIQYVPNGIAYKYLVFGVSLDGMHNYYAHGNTVKEAFSKMLERGIRR